MALSAGSVGTRYGWGGAPEPRRSNRFHDSEASRPAVVTAGGSRPDLRTPCRSARRLWFVDQHFPRTEPDVRAARPWWSGGRRRPPRKHQARRHFSRDARPPRLSRPSAAARRTRPAARASGYEASFRFRPVLTGRRGLARSPPVSTTCVRRVAVGDGRRPEPAPRGSTALASRPWWRPGARAPLSGRAAAPHYPRPPATTPGVGRPCRRTPSNRGTDRNEQACEPS